MPNPPDAPTREPGQVVVELRLPQSLDAPFVARRALGSLIVKGPRLRSVDTSLLAGELVTLLLENDAPIRLTLLESGRSIRLEARSDGHVAPDPDQIVQTLLNRIADRWSSDEEMLWFEIDLVRQRDLTDLGDDELFALMPDDRAARDELFERYVPFASSIARRYRRRHRGSDDLEQVALMGLVRALERFDVEVGVKFTTFAGRWISGVLKRHLRDESWSMRVPRSLKEDILNVTKARDDLEQRLGRRPTPKEVADELDMTDEQLQEAMLAGDVYTLASLNAPVGEGRSGDVQSLIGSDDPDFAVVEEWPEIEAVLEDLSDRDQQILHLRFFEDLTQAEIAPIVGVSQVHVSRILKRTLDTLRQRLEIDDDDYAPESD